MIAIDTETTGLWWQHKSEMFALGIIDGDHYTSTFIPVDPFTRKPKHGWSKNDRHDVQDMIFGKDPVIFQNCKFDIKALCRAGFFDWEEPSKAEFWKNITELSHLCHLHDSTDAKFSSSLKKLTPKYLDGNYESEDELLRIVTRCRLFVKNRNPDWLIGSPEAIPPAKPKDKFNKCDMWLPAALRNDWPDQKELEKYMGRGNKHLSDYPLLGSIVDGYLKDDCKNTLHLAEGFLTAIMEENSVEDAERCLALNKDLLPVLWRMETLGIAVDRKAMDEAIDSCHYWMEHCHNKCQKISGRKVRSFTPALLAEILYDDFKLEPTRFTKKTNKPSADSVAREKLKRQCDEEGHAQGSAFLTYFIAFSKYNTKCEYLTSYQRVNQQASKIPYNNGALSDDSWFLFPSLNETGTGTIRFSSSNPNSQNIEKANDPFDQDFEDVAKLLEESPSLRTVFIPETNDRWWFPIDYSQLQLRIFAAATEDPALTQSFKDGYDFHDFMARVIFDIPDGRTPTTAQRRIAKNVNFGFIFGSGEKKIDATAKRKGLYSYLMDCFPGAHDFIESPKQKIRDTGMVHTLGGYPLKIPLTLSNWGKWSYAAHMGVNYIVQGTEGEIVKRAMVQTDNYLVENYPDARLAMQIHDEIVFDTPARPPKKHIRNLCNIMHESGKFYGVDTPVEAELCLHNLAEKRKVLL